MPDVTLVQQKMLELEASLEEVAGFAPTVGQSIALLVRFDHEAAFDRALDKEIDRTLRLANSRYARYTKITPRNLVTLGFLQGVTFGVAAATVRGME